MAGCAGGELRAHDLRAAEDRRARDDRVAVDRELGVVGEHRLVELHRQASRRRRGRRRSCRTGSGRGRCPPRSRRPCAAPTCDAGQPAAEVAGGVHLRRAVRAEGAATASPSPAKHASTVSPISRALASISSVIVLTLSSRPPRRRPRPCSSAISDDLQVLEERHDLLVALAVVFDDLAGLALFGAGRRRRSPGRRRPSRRSTASMPRSATFTSSTGLDLAAMIPLKLG